MELSEGVGRFAAWVREETRQGQVSASRAVPDGSALREPGF
jgi:hypothetical protein